jgi:hypothetical protein
VPPRLLEGLIGLGLLLPAPGAGVIPSHKRLALPGGGGAGGEKGIGGGGDWVSGLAPRASVLGPPPDAVARNTSTLRTGACHGLRGTPSEPCSRNPDLDMAPCSRPIWVPIISELTDKSTACPPAFRSWSISPLYLSNAARASREVYLRRGDES